MCEKVKNSGEIKRKTRKKNKEFYSNQVSNEKLEKQDDS